MVRWTALVWVVAGCAPVEQRPPLPKETVDSGTDDTGFAVPPGTGGFEPDVAEACPEGIYSVLAPLTHRDTSVIALYGTQCVVALAESDCPYSAEIQYIEPKAGGGWEGVSEGFIYCDRSGGMAGHPLVEVTFTWSSDRDTLFVGYDRGDALGGYGELVMMSPFTPL